MTVPAEKCAEPRPLVYIVDDEIVVLDSLSRCLEAAGYPTKTFGNPVVAYAAFASASRKPDLLIVDYTMPELSGLRLLGRCRALVPQLKALSVSGTLTTDALKRNGEKPDACLRKPFQNVALLALVQLLVG